MPEFILRGTHAQEFRALDAFTQGYIEALFFTECSPNVPAVEWNLDIEPDEGSLPCDVGFADLAPEALGSIVADCTAFIETPAWRALGSAALANEGEQPDDAQAGRDFWFSRNRHGVGFWDGDWQEPHATALDEAAKSFSAVSVYLGDDGKVHLS